jgi:hypothetical protein
VVREELVRKIFSSAGAAIAVKVVTGFAVAALASTAAAAATEAALTGSLNPTDWGQQVRQTVATCKETLRASGTRGIGQCVSAFAKQHGKIVSAEHRASGTRLNNGNGNGNANGHSKAKGDNGKGKSQSHGQPSHKSNHSVVVASAEN